MNMAFYRTSPGGGSVASGVCAYGVAGITGVVSITGIAGLRGWRCRA